MKIPIDIPIIVKRVRFIGPTASRELDLILDTGAVYTAISWDAAKDIGLDPAASQRRTPIVTANGVIEVPLITVGQVTLNELEATNVDVICHDIPEVVEVEGLMGLSFLKHFRTVVDFPNNIVEICHELTRLPHLG